MDLAVDQTSSRSRWSLSGGVAEFGLTPVQCIARQRNLLASRSYGRIVTENASLVGIYGRWWPYLGDMFQVALDQAFRNCKRDRCELYYHQAIGSPGFLTLSYIRSGPETRAATCYAAMLILDEVARIRNANALVANVTNSRITDRLAERWGWERHCLNWKGRHFIKRFYGVYPELPQGWRSKLSIAPPASVLRTEIASQRRLTQPVRQ